MLSVSLNKTLPSSPRSAEPQVDGGAAASDRGEEGPGGGVRGGLGHRHQPEGVRGAPYRHLRHWHRGDADRKEGQYVQRCLVNTTDCYFNM